MTVPSIGTGLINSWDSCSCEGVDTLCGISLVLLAAALRALLL